MRHSYQRAMNFSAKVVVLHFCIASAVLAQTEDPVPTLAPIEWRGDAETIHLKGIDPAGPRNLDLWTWQEEKFERLAMADSDREGRFDFGQIPVHHALLYLTVSVRGVSPSTDRLVVVERALAAPITSVTFDRGFDEVTVIPAVYDGEIRIRDADSGLLIARWAIDAEAARGDSIDLYDILGTSRPEAIWIHQVLGDGRVSEPAYYRFRDE